MTNKDVPHSESDIYELMETAEILLNEAINYSWPHFDKEEWQNSVNQTKEMWRANELDDFIRIL